MPISVINFQLQFVSGKQSFNIEFQEQAASSSNTVCVNGKNYSLAGDNFKIEWIKAKIPELKSHTDISLEGLENKLSSLGAKNIRHISLSGNQATTDEEQIKEAFNTLSQARQTLQDLWDGKKKGNIEQAKLKVKDAETKCRDLSWETSNASIAKKQKETKENLSKVLIPQETQNEILRLAIEEFGSLEEPGIVVFENKRYTIAQDVVNGSSQIIQLPAEGEDILGNGFSNVVVRVCNESNKCFQALRKSRTPQGEESVASSLNIFKDIHHLKGTTSGPVATIREGKGGILSPLYDTDASKWLKMMPPPELRWKGFNSLMGNFIEFAEAGNVHGDITLVNVSVDYEKKDEESAPSIYADPAILKLEDLDGACHIIAGYDEDQQPIYNEKAFQAGLTPAFGTKAEIMKWFECIQTGQDLEGLAKIRCAQDIFCAGIALYQIITSDFDLNNLYLNVEKAPRNNRVGEDGEFIKGTPNEAAIRMALEDYNFLTNEQKDAVVQVIISATSLDPQERATLEDLQKAHAFLSQ